MNKKGFTLIELLAVIIILGILMIIAIPSVTRYISDSRKNAYVDTAKEIVGGTRNLVNEGKLGMYDTNTTYYIPSSYIKTENASKSPYGDFTQAYVGVVYDGTGYKYYWISVDDAGQGVKDVTSIEELDIDNIESDLSSDDIFDTVKTTGIGDRSNILVLDDNGNWSGQYNAENHVNGGSTVDSPDMLYTNIKTENTTNSSSLNYSNSNGSGLYVLSGTENNTNPIYFYRGTVSNNNLIFANYCWKIVRTTETGGIKIVFSGAVSGGKCNNTGTASQLNQVKYSEYNSDNTYMGYKYGVAGANNYNDAHSNQTNSTIKEYIDSWYQSNLSSFSSYLEDSVWCNDRSIAPDSPGQGYGTNATNYNGRYRLNINKTPSLDCQNNNDKYTMSSSIGNGKLSYPIALLTADEVALAGAVWNQSSSHYLNTGTPWWTMTPSRLNSVYPSVFVVLENGGLYAHSGNLDGVRPAVVLKRSVKIKDGTDGSSTNPYVVE